MVCENPDGKPFECLKYSFTGTYTPLLSYSSYKGGYVTDSYDGPVCKIDSVEDEVIKASSVKNTTGINCNDKTKYCYGYYEPPEDVDYDPSKMPKIGELDPRVGQKTCVLFENKSGIIGNITNIQQASTLKNYKGDLYTRTTFGPYLPGIGYVKTQTANNEVDTKVLRYPKDGDIIKEPTIVIKAIELSVEGKEVLRLSGVYYTNVSDINKNDKIRGYNEEVGLIDINEFNRKDIFPNNATKVGNSNIQGSKKLLIGSYQDSCLVGIWYKYQANGLGSKGAIGICVAFRRLFDSTFKTEYIGIDEGNLITTKPISSLWIGNECPRGEFINQLEVASIDLVSTKFKLPKETVRMLIVTFAGGPALGASILMLLAALAFSGPAAPVILGILAIIIGAIGGILLLLNELGVSFMEVTTIPTGQGFKGVTMYRSINYNIPRGLYNKWLPSIEPLRCCQLLSDQQYEPDSIEDYVCRNNLEYVVQNSFPNAYPNGLCREVLQEHCNNKDNIDEDLCKMACGMSGEYIINCDSGIQGYCNQDYFKAKAKDKTMKPKIMGWYKDQVCNCMYKQSSPDAYKSLKEEGMTNYVDSFKNFLTKKMDTSKQDKVLPNFREECSVGVCSRSPYKLFDQKRKLNMVGCNSIEQCFSSGYQIPATTDNDTRIDCNRFLNTDTCISPLEAKFTVINDISKSECKTLVQGSTVDDIRFEPQQCEVSKTFYPSLLTDDLRKEAAKLCITRKNKDTGEDERVLKLTRRVTVPGYPGNDPNMCPPFKKNYKGEYRKDSRGNNLRIEMEKWVECPEVITKYK